MIRKHHALDSHSQGRRKIEIRPTKPTETQRDLSLAYTPAQPALEIRANPESTPTPPRGTSCERIEPLASFRKMDSLSPRSSSIRTANPFSTSNVYIVDIAQDHGAVNPPR